MDRVVLILVQLVEIERLLWTDRRSEKNARIGSYEIELKESQHTSAKFNVV